MLKGERLFHQGMMICLWRCRNELGTESWKKDKRWRRYGFQAARGEWPLQQKLPQRMGDRKLLKGLHWLNAGFELTRVNWLH